MIKSKNNTFGYWRTPIMLVFIEGMCLLTYFKSDFHQDKIMSMIFGIGFGVLLLPQLWITSKQIIIDTFEKQIIITHFFTKRKIVYHFSELDGYIDMNVKPARGYPYRTIYLVLGKKFIQEISTVIYSNTDLLEVALKDVKYLGQQRSSYFKHFKILFSKEVLEEPE